MIIQGNLQALKQYIHSMSDINKAESGLSLLHKAAVFDKPKSAELILSMGADVNNKGIGGMTPHRFRYSRCKQVCKRKTSQLPDE